MECLFYGVKKNNCSLFQRCEGIYLMMLNLGASKKNANTFSKYIWRRSFHYKLKDLIKDPPSGFLNKTIKPIAKLIVTFSKPLIRNIYGLEEQFTSFENRIFSMETKNEAIEPITYFNDTGKAYGLIFKTAALISHCDSKRVREITILGRNLGTLISMRDSVQDKELDIKTGSFNPFICWSKSDMVKYYHNYRKELVKEINNILISKIKMEKDSKERNKIFHGINIFTQASINPFGLCKKYLQANSYMKSSLNLYSINYIIKPNEAQEPPEDTCRVNCCASTADEVCHIPNNPCKICCHCCDLCAICGEGFSGCA